MTVLLNVFNGRDALLQTAEDSSSEMIFAVKDAAMSKIGSVLASVYDSYQVSVQQDVPQQDSDTAIRQTMQVSDFQSDSPQFDSSLLSMQAGWIAIDAVAAEDPETLLQDLQALGFRNASSFGAMISGELPIAALNQLTQLDSLQFSQPVYKPFTNVGRVTSQADVSMRADVARRTFGVSGAGVTVGVLSDSFNNLGGASRDVASGDLPAGVTILRDLPSGGTDEGRAMMQLIHDVAPGAALASYSAFEGEAAFANGILALARAGAKVIVDDVGYFTEPMFQDGVIAQAVDTVTAAGVSYFSSAGNSGRASYSAAFNPSGALGTAGIAHDFNPGSGVDQFQRISLAVGAALTLSVQWDSPFYSVNPRSGGSRSDIDVYLVDGAGNVVARNIDDNLRKDPVAILRYENDGSSGTSFSLVIVNAGGVNPNVIKYISYDQGSIREYDTKSSTVVGHANASGANAVGAAPFFKTPAFGTNPAQLESFSSVGGTPILFDKAGNRLSRAELRLNPGFVAPDGTNTTFFGSDSSEDADTFPNFFGTSAAAPHAAAVAALMLEANPTLSPNAITQTLRSTALDMDDPGTAGFDTGFDLATGYGLIQADRAVAAVITQADDDSLTGARDLGVLVGNRSVQDFVGDSDPVDFYRFTLANTSNFGLSLTDLTADADVFLIKDINRDAVIQQGEVISISENSGTNPERLALNGLTAGNYYVAVQQYSGNTPYTLALSATSV